LTKVIFDQNPTNEFFIEESFPLEWMYPHLTPFGIIMKINRQPLPQLTEEVFSKDHEFWSKYSERLIGNWITYDTPVQEIADFALKTFLRHNFSGFEGDRRFVRDDQAQKAFSKLRSSIAGVYAWRLGPDCPPEYRPRTEAERQRLIKETDFAFRQAFAFCPYSPEAVFRYVNFLVSVQGRVEDARIVAETCARLDPFNQQVAGLVKNLSQAKNQQVMMQDANAHLTKLQSEWNNSRTNLQLGLNLAGALLQFQQTAAAVQVLDQIMASTNLDSSAVVACAQGYLQMGNMTQLEAALARLTVLTPDSPEAWYDLAAIKSTLGKPQEAIAALKTAVSLSNARRAQSPSAKDLLAEARTDPRFEALKTLPEFKALVPAE
jgi:tetratricopeptide (TPR) repeat protein